MPQLCSGTIGAQQAPGEDAMARGEHVLEPVEQPRLVGGGDARVEQPAADHEPPHAGRPPDGPQAGVADDGVDRDRGALSEPRIIASSRPRVAPSTCGCVRR